jgi:hypothetical protein
LVGRQVAFLLVRITLAANRLQFAAQTFHLRIGCQRRAAILGCLDSAVAPLNVFVVPVDRLVRQAPRIGIVVVQVGHHLGGHPHCPPVIDPKLGAQHGSDEQSKGDRRAVTEILIAYAGVKDFLP